MPRDPEKSRTNRREQSYKARSRQMKQRQRTILIVAVAVIAVALAALIIYPFLKPPFQGIDRPSVQNNSTGDVNAKVKVEEFSDFQCPYCRKWSEENEASFIKKYVETGQVYYTYTPFSFLGPESVRSAEAAYCAMDQGKFWQYHDILFANQGAENQGVFSDENLKKFAQDIKLDMTAFNDCLNSGKFTQKVTDNVNYGRSKGVNATPYFLVNDKLVDSTQLEAAVEAALKQ